MDRILIISSLLMIYLEVTIIKYVNLNKIVTIMAVRKLYFLMRYLNSTYLDKVSGNFFYWYCLRDFQVFFTSMFIEGACRFTAALNCPVSRNRCLCKLTKPENDLPITHSIATVKDDHLLCSHQLFAIWLIKLLYQSIWWTNDT